MEKIQIMGLKKGFNEDEQDIIKEYSMKYYKKIERDLPGLLVIHAKKHDKTGERCKYSFQAKINAPTTLINVKDDDWELHRALNKVLKKVENQIKHKFKTE